MTKPTLLILVSMAFAVACQSKGPAQSSATAAKPGAAAATATAKTAAEAKPVPAQLPATIARVNGESIPKAEFERAVRSLEARAGQPVPVEKRNEVYRGVLNQMIAYKLLLQESKSLKLSVTDADVDARLKAIQGQFPNEQAFTKALGDQGVNLQQLKDDQRQQMLVSKVIDTQVAPKVSVSDKDVQDYYEKNPDKFKEPENFRVEHILIAIPPNADAAAKAKAKADATAVLKQVKGGADFQKLAKEKSQDPGSAQNGGEVRFAKGQMVPPFEQAAVKLKPGEVSPVVETQFGFHIIKMIEHRPARVVALEEAKAQLTEFLKEQQGNQKAEAYVAALKAKSKIEIYI
ncbi:MAG: peptidylprolyl isomerase [Bacteroidales bacterium]